MSLVPYNITALAETDVIGGGKNILAGATVNITKFGGGSAQIYADQLGATLITLPTVVDSHGELLFFIESGDYYFVINGKSYRVAVAKSKYDVENFSDLANTILAPNEVVFLKRHTVDGYGGGWFQDFSGTVTNDGGTKINSSVNVGRCVKRINFDYLTPELFGWYPGIADSTPPIQLAFNAANAGPYKRIVGNGVANISGTLVMGASQITLNGQTSDAVTDSFKIVKANAGDMLQITGDQCSMAGVSFYHNGSSGYVVKCTGESCTFDYNTFKKLPGSSGDTFYFNKSNTHIRKNHFGYGPTAGFTVVCDRTASGGININSRFDDNYVGGNGNGVLIGSSDSSPRPEGFMMSRNDMVNTGGSYVEIQTVLDFTMTDNMFDGAGGIYFNPKGSGIESVRINGRYLSTGSYATGISGGICIKNNAAATVSIKDLKMQGVRFAAASYGVNLTANVLGGTINDVTLRDCHFEGMDQQGVYMKNVNNGRILDCDFADASNNLTLDDGTLGSYLVDGNKFNPASTIVRTTTTSLNNFTFGFNRGIKTKGYGTATVSVPTTATEVFLNVPHGLNVTPDLNKVIATAILVSGDLKSITPVVRSVNATNVVLQLNFTWVASSTIRANVLCEF